MKIRSFAVGLSKARAAYRILSMLLFLLILNTFPRVNFASEDEARSQPVGSAALKSVISSKTNSMKGMLSKSNFSEIELMNPDEDLQKKNLETADTGKRQGILWQQCK